MACAEISFMLHRVVCKGPQIPIPQSVSCLLYCCICSLPNKNANTYTQTSSWRREVCNSQPERHLGLQRYNGTLQKRERNQMAERERDGEHLLIARAAVAVIIAVVGFYVVLLVFYFISPITAHSLSHSLSRSLGSVSWETMWRNWCDEDFSAPSWPVYR